MINRVRNVISRLLCACVGITVVTLLLSCGNSRDFVVDDNTFADVRVDINDYLERTGVSSVAVAVAKDGRIVWEEGFGWANVEMKIESTPHVLYTLASITKNLTATGLMVLVEKEDIDIRQPANLYLGDAQLRAFQGKAENATIRRLLQHSAGLPLYYDAYYEHQLDQKIRLDETIRRYGILVATPGESYQYSSLGYGIIEHIIERTTDKNYADFMRQEVFEPLGMSEAALFDSLPANVAIEYRSDNSPAQFAQGAVRAGGDIYCSAHDLVRYGMFHLKNDLSDQESILSDSLIDLMRADFDPDVKNSEYALGWRIEKVAGYEVFSHNGGGLGSDTRLAIIPSENLAVVVLANSRAGNSTSISDKIVRAILPDFERHSFWDRVANIFNGGKAPPFDPKESLAGEWSGNITTYKGQVPVSLTIQADGQARIRKSFDAAGNGEWIDSKRAVSLRDGIIEVMFDAEILGLEENRPERYLLLRLQYDGTILYGSANAGNSTELIYCVPSYVEFAKVGNPK